NNGTVTGTASVILMGDTFQDTDADGLLDVGSEVYLSGVPDGLVPEVRLLNNTQAGSGWQERSLISGSFKAITYGNGLFVAVGTNASNQVALSTDGVNWTQYTAPVAHWKDVVYGNGLFVAVSSYDNSPAVMTSPDGIHWTIREAPVGLWESIAYGAGR